MKRLTTLILLVIVGGAIALAMWFLYSNSKSQPVVFEVEQPAVTDIVKKTVATGSIVPRQEVEVKPKISGVLSELTVVPGQTVKRGDPIGKVQIIPDAVTLNRAESEARSAQIAFDNAKREYDREMALLKQGVIAEAEVAQYRTTFELRRQDLSSANANLQLQREGQIRGQSKTSNIVVTATVDGMIIDVPVKVGYSVIQANNFNPGTTVATIADMGDMIFQGNVDESEVGKVKEGLKLAIKIGAIEDVTFDGTLEYIAPKGKEIDGAIQFEIKAAMVKQPGVFVRAGYSANADIVLDQKKQVLAVREAVVQYDNGKAFVEVETQPQQFAKKDIQLGLSDGVHIEVKGGVTATDKIKVPATAGPAKEAEGSGGGSKPNAGAAGGKPTGAPRR
ncbi:MAG: efflux RND transporter periplasmic adaptor subunit [Deltaproteobacteria bacterium]|nr:efflux RND transporter periplasmic adaptor subunit [Deltaproteobacteria bacterium]